MSFYCNRELLKYVAVVFDEIFTFFSFLHFFAKCMHFLPNYWLNYLINEGNCVWQIPLLKFAKCIVIL